MGFYTSVLIEKEKKDNNLVSSADEGLRNNHISIDSLGKVENVRRAIAEILKRLKIEPREVRNCRTTEELLCSMLDPENILYEKIDMEEYAWRRESNLILAFDENGNPLVISPFVAGYSYYQPTSLKRGVVTRKMKLQKEGYIIFRPLEGKEFSLRSFFKLMIKLVSPKDIVLIAAATLAVSLLGLVAPNVNLSVLKRVVKEGEAAIPFLWTSAIVLISAGLARGFFTITKSFLLGNMKQRISMQMQNAIMAKLLLMPYEFFETGGTGKLSNQLRNGSRLSDMLIDFVMNSLLSTAFSLVYIPQMFKLAPQLVIPALIILLIQIVLSMAVTLLSADYTSKKIALQQDTDSFLFEALKGMQKIKNMGASKRVYAKVAENYGRVLAADILPPAYIKLKDPVISFISSLGTVIVLIMAAATDVGQQEYIAFTASFGLLAGSVTTLVSMCNSIVSMKPLHEQLRNLFSSASVEEGVEYVNELRGEITVEDLHYSYTKSERGCVDGINLHIAEGEKVAIVGESGCGKSTFLKLILGMITPDSGSILYDGKPLATLNKRSLRKKIGSVFQFTRVFPGTVYENISFTAQNVSEEDAWDAAEKAAIADDIRALPIGMETEISEGNGGGFSGGQKQRLMLARAFAQKPSVLIMDEATSALDNISQHAVLESVYKMNCTVIMVAHRLSTVIDCDRIIMFKDGKIEEEGTYSELIARNGSFAELVKKQQVEK